MGSEKLFENKVKRYLDSIGAWYMKVWGNGMQRSGIPDIIGCINGRFFALEIKADGGRKRPLQEYEIRRIHEAYGYARFLYPKEFDEFKEEFEKWMKGKSELTR